MAGIVSWTLARARRWRPLSVPAAGGSIVSVTLPDSEAGSKIIRSSHSGWVALSATAVSVVTL